MKPPTGAKRVFKGILFNVYHWDQEMYDGSLQTFEMIERKPSVGIIAVVNKRILILKQEQPLKPLYFALPGGNVEDEQSHLQAAEAELLQETGYQSDSMNLLAEYRGGTKMFFHQSAFIAKNCRKVAEQQLDSGEQIEISMIDFETFLQLCREESFAAPLGLKFMMYEALIDQKKKADLKEKIFT